jgi:hypothetical protein
LTCVKKDVRHTVSDKGARGKGLMSSEKLLLLVRENKNDFLLFIREFTRALQQDGSTTKNVKDISELIAIPTNDRSSPSLPPVIA